MEVPVHVGIIMDGNRRFSKRLMLKPWMGHEWGAKKAESVISWCKDFNIKELTLYTLSIQNFNRPKQEFDFLMKVFYNNFTKLKTDERIFKDKIRLNFIGRIWMLPKNLQDVLKDLSELTRNHDGFIINFAIAYGGREEVIDAVMKLANDVKTGKLDVSKINQETFSNYLYMPDEPDLVIRTGGEMRTSNFLIWQSNYSELFFIDKMWPEFEKEDFQKVLVEYRNRQRRFGA